MAEPGLKANITDIQAAIGRAQLACLPAWQGRRAQLAARYDDALAGLPGLVLPLRPAAGRHAWHLYQVRVTPEFGTSRDDVIEALGGAGIGTSVHFIPVHQLSGYRRVLRPAEIRSVPVTDQVAGQLLSLPMYPGFVMPMSITSRLPWRPWHAIPRLVTAHGREEEKLLSLSGTRPSGSSGGLATLVVGAGEAGRTLARSLRRSPNYGLAPIGFVDDAHSLVRVMGLPVYRPISALPEIARKHRAEACIVAIPSMPAARLAEIVQSAGTVGLHVRYCRRSWPQSSAMRACLTCASSGSRTCLAVASCTLSVIRRRR